MYKLHIAGTQIPVVPGKIEIKVNGKNETVTLVNEGEVNLIKPAGLSDIEFELLLPAQPYSFAIYDTGFKEPEYYLELFRYLKSSKSYFTIDLAREFPAGDPEGKGINQRSFFYFRVTLESYTIIEDAEEGFDLKVKLKFKEYHPFGTKTLVPNLDGTGYIIKKTDIKNPVRVVEVRQGESLYDVCMREFGKADAETVENIYKLNKAEIDSKNIGDVSYVVNNRELWADGEYTSRANAAALIDKAFLGGHINFGDDKPNIHWAQPYIISLNHKNALDNVDDWIQGADGNISQALLLALVDKITDGTVSDYVGRETDHWGRNHLDSLCDKGIILEPDKWLDFDGPVLNQNTVALLNKALAATVSRYSVYEGSRLKLYQ